MKNQYKGKTPKQIWREWTPTQRYHFMNDHSEVIDGFSINMVNKYMEKPNYDVLPKGLKYTIKEHIESESYKYGGSLNRKINGGRLPMSWYKELKGKKIRTIFISHDYPLSGQLEKLTGDKWGTQNFESITGDELTSFKPFRHKKTGKIFIAEKAPIKPMRAYFAQGGSLPEPGGNWGNVLLDVLFANTDNLKMERGGGRLGEADFSNWTADDHRKQSNIHRENMRIARGKGEGHKWHYEMAKRDMHIALAKQKGNSMASGGGVDDYKKNLGMVEVIFEKV